MQTENHYTETDLGNVSPNPRGDYNNTVKYEYLDLVTMQGGSYLCVIPVRQTITGTAPEPGKTTEHWQCLTMPGDMTPQYTEAHDKVVRLAKEVAQNTTKVAEDKQSVAQMETDVRQLKEQTAESARQAENSKDSAVGSARAAKTAEDNIRQVANNVNTLVNGFDTHVAEKTTEATQAVETAKDNAVQAVGRQETASVQAVKDQTTTYITEQKNLAKQELDKKVEQFGIDVNAIKAEISEEGQKQITNVQEATTAELAKITEKGTEQAGIVTTEGEKQVQAVQTAAQEIVADREQINTNKEGVAKLKEDLTKLEERTCIENAEYFSEDITDNFTIDGFITNGTSIQKDLGFSTDFIPTKIGDIFVYRLMEDFNSTYSINLYDGSRQFIKGVKISTKDTSDRQVIGEYTVTEGSFIRFSTVSNDKESALLYKKQKNNSKSFFKYKDTIGKIEETNVDITEEILKNKILDKYIGSTGNEFDYPNQNCYVTDFIPVNEGEQYSYLTRALYTNPSCVVYDRYKNLLEKYGQINGINKETIVIPPMGHYMRFNIMNDTQNIFTVTTKKIKSIPEIISEKSGVPPVTIPSDYQELNVKISPGYLSKANNAIGESTKYVHTDYISIADHDWFNANIYYGWTAVGYIILDDKKTTLYALEANTSVTEKVILKTQDITSKYPTAKYIRFVGKKDGIESLKIFTNKKTTVYDEALVFLANKNNLLYNKKIAFCGDSFTEASNLGVDFYDPYYGCYKSYGWRIANRNCMRLYHDGRGGSTMHISNKATPTERRPFAHERYKKVPKDCDYIILQFGLNESAIAASSDTKGTKESTDTSTMWGSWNVVLEYLITNHPTARIGVIMSDAWMPQSYYDTLKEICEWWGIPLLDLGGDANIPLMNGGRRKGSGLTLNPKVADLRNKQFYQNYETGDSHPNDAGHEWRSTVVEDFIRRL